MTVLAEFTIPGRVAGKGRARFSSGFNRATGQRFTRTYTDEKTTSAEAMVRTIAAQAMRGRAPSVRAVSLEVFMVENPPPSWSKRRRATTRWMVKKPDIDNVLKLIGDALNKMVWADDSQLSYIVFRREYRLDEAERVEVRICELESDSLEALEPELARAPPKEASLFDRIDVV